MNSFRTSLVGCALLTTFGTSVFALGFRNPDQSARATAQGEAFVAQADDASAIYYNPAGLAQIRGTEGSSGGYLSTRDIEFQGAGTEGVNDPVYSMHAFGASGLGTENWTVGLGTYVPFGNDIDYGKKGTFRYLLTETGLTVQNYALAVAYKFCDQFSFGAAFNFYDGSTYQNRLVPFSILVSPLVPDGKFKFEGDGQAFGATLGAMWKINDQHQVGVVYRSPFAIDFHGHAVVKNDPLGVYGRSPATAEIQFPQSVAMGYAFRPTPKLKLEVDVEWTDWDSLNTVRLHSNNPAFATDPSSRIPFNWMSSFFYEFGAQYTLNDKWALRAGYIFSENTVPNSTFSPAQPDSDRHVLSAGVGFTLKHFGVDLTYQYSLSTDRTVRNSADTNFDGQGDLDGKWKSQGHGIMLTSTLRF
ncbi:MAG: putative outer membrane protein [Verrucomicrobiae bacterium]|nr:putative outer membrane protein [Verrucomicrobiae bacterium]